MYTYSIRTHAGHANIVALLEHSTVYMMYYSMCTMYYVHAYDLRCTMYQVQKYIVHSTSYIIIAQVLNTHTTQHKNIPVALVYTHIIRCTRYLVHRTYRYYVVAATLYIVPCTRYEVLLHTLYIRVKLLRYT